MYSHIQIQLNCNVTVELIYILILLSLVCFKFCKFMSNFACSSCSYYIGEVTERSVGELRVMLACFAVLELFQQVLLVYVEINRNNIKVWNACVSWVIIRNVKCSHESWQMRLNFWHYWQCLVVQCFLRWSSLYSNLLSAASLSLKRKKICSFVVTDGFDCGGQYVGTFSDWDQKTSELCIEAQAVMHSMNHISLPSR